MKHGRQAGNAAEARLAPLGEPHSALSACKIVSQRVVSYTCHLAMSCNVLPGKLLIACSCILQGGGGGAEPASKPTKAKLGEANSMYYDEEVRTAAAQMHFSFSCSSNCQADGDTSCAAALFLDLLCYVVPVGQGNIESPMLLDVLQLKCWRDKNSDAPPPDLAPPPPPLRSATPVSDTGPAAPSDPAAGQPLSQRCTQAFCHLIWLHQWPVLVCLE